MPSRKASLALLLASVAVYVAALFHDAFCVEGRCSDWPSWTILLFGALALGGTLANLAWLANPVLFAAWILTWFGERVAAVVTALAALALASSFILQKTVVVNEAGLDQAITGLERGYWLWLASTAIACAAAVAAGKPPARAV